MPILMPATYEFYSKKKKKHKFIKKKKFKEKPYGWKDLNLKTIESNIQSILLKYNTRKNNQRTWDKLKKEVNEYMKYLWNKNKQGFSSVNDFALVKCSLQETMSIENLLNNQLILGVLINLNNKKESPIYISIIQQQYPKA
jgi:hypothetical protein